MVGIVVNHKKDGSGIDSINVYLKSSHEDLEEERENAIEEGLISETIFVKYPFGEDYKNPHQELSDPASSDIIASLACNDDIRDELELLLTRVFREGYFWRGKIQTKF